MFFVYVSYLPSNILNIRESMYIICFISMYIYICIYIYVCICHTIYSIISCLYTQYIIYVVYTQDIIPTCHICTINHVYHLSKVCTVVFKEGDTYCDDSLIRALKTTRMSLFDQSSLKNLKNYGNFCGNHPKGTLIVHPQNQHRNVDNSVVRYSRH